MTTVKVIGAGLAGSEAAWQLAERGISVQLYEMRPKVMSPAHKTGNFAELVCSNSLRSNALTNAVGVLKEELRRMNSLIMKMADLHAVPAGSALAVDREAFSQAVTDAVRNHPLIEVIEQEWDEKLAPIKPKKSLLKLFTENKADMVIDEFTPYLGVKI